MIFNFGVVCLVVLAGVLLEAMRMWNRRECAQGRHRWKKAISTGYRKTPGSTITVDRVAQRYERCRRCRQEQVEPICVLGRYSSLVVEGWMWDAMEKHPEHICWIDDWTERG